jgi:hypothetical protein
LGNFLKAFSNFNLSLTRGESLSHETEAIFVEFKFSSRTGSTLHNNIDQKGSKKPPLYQYFDKFSDV